MEGCVEGLLDGWVLGREVGAAVFGLEVVGSRVGLNVVGANVGLLGCVVGLGVATLAPAAANVTMTTSKGKNPIMIYWGCV